MGISIEAYDAMVKIYSVLTKNGKRTNEEPKLLPAKGEVIRFKDGTFLEKQLWFVHLCSSPLHVEEGKWQLLDLKTTTRVAVADSRAEVIAKAYARLKEKATAPMFLLKARRHWFQIVGKAEQSILEAQFKKHQSE